MMRHLITLAAVLLVGLVLGCGGNSGKKDQNRDKFNNDKPIPADKGE